MIHEAIYNLYPEVIVIRGEDAFDKDDNQVEYDQELVEAKAAELQAKEDAIEQIAVDARQSALNKLMALGLTEEEALALGVK
jgi:hypothetical protein